MKMFKDEYQSVCNAAKGKLGLLEKSPLGYFVSSIVAGMFIALGGFVTFTLGAHLTAAGCTITKPIMAFAFASALSLVVMAGAELFTGNNFVMAAGSFMGQVSWANTVKVWVVCYLGNLVGALLGAVMFVAAGVPTGTVGEFFAKYSGNQDGWSSRPAVCERYHV